MKNKVSVIGAGNVGATIAMQLASKNFADIVVLDINEGTPKGKALDISEVAPIMSYDVSVTGTTDYADVKGSDIVIITAGIPRKPGMSRDDLLKINTEIVAGSAQNIAHVAPDAIIIVVSNPLDATTFVAKEASGFASNKVFGMAGVLDSARFCHFISLKTGFSVENIQTMVLGGHGDTMVPLLRYTTIAGIPLSHFVSQDDIESLVERTRNGGAEIVGHLKTGSAFYAPAASTVEMVECIFFDKKKILPVSAFLSGEYGAKGIYLGVPAMLGADGVEKVIELPLLDDEKESLDKSISAVKGLIDLMDMESLLKHA